MQYKDIVEKLQVSEDFLREKRELIAERAGRILDEKEFADDRASRLASTILVCATRSKVLQSVKERLKADPLLGKYDPIRIITMSYLYHMVKHPEKVFGGYAEGLKENLRGVHKAMDRASWHFVRQEEVMKYLGIEMLVT